MTLSGLFFVVAALALAPILSILTRRVVPGVVFEIGLGILIGPAVLGLVRSAGFVAELADLGLALLMFLAGLEVNLRQMRGATLGRAAGSWGLSVLLAGAVALVLVATGQGELALYAAIPLTTTALGTLVPILRETSVLSSPIGRHVMAIGTIGEFGPIVLIALLLGTQGAVSVLLFLLVFAAVVAGGLWAAANWRLTWLRRTVAQGLHNTSQLPVRAAMLIIVFLVVVADDLGIDTLLGSFAAGLIVRAAISTDAATGDSPLFVGKMEAVGFGVLIPVFFVVSGMSMDVTSLLAQPAAPLVVPATVVGLLVVRGLPTLLVYRDFPPHERRTLALFSATALPLVVVVTGLGVDAGALPPAIAATMVMGGLVSVLIMPIAGVRRFTRS